MSEMTDDGLRTGASSESIARQKTERSIKGPVKTLDVDGRKVDYFESKDKHGKHVLVSVEGRQILGHSVDEAKDLVRSKVKARSMVEAATASAERKSASELKRAARKKTAKVHTVDTDAGPVEIWRDNNTWRRVDTDASLGKRKDAAIKKLKDAARQSLPEIATETAAPVAPATQPLTKTLKEISPQGPQPPLPTKEFTAASELPPPPSKWELRDASGNLMDTFDSYDDGVGHVEMIAPDVASGDVRVNFVSPLDSTYQDITGPADAFQSMAQVGTDAADDLSRNNILNLVTRAIRLQSNRSAAEAAEAMFPKLSAATQSKIGTETERLYADMAAIQNKEHDFFLKQGGKSKKLATHYPRRGIRGKSETIGRDAPQVRTANTKARRIALRNVDAEVVNMMGEDPILRELADADEALEYILEWYGDELDPNFYLKNKKQILGVEGHAKEIWKYFKAKSVGRVFENDPMLDHANYVVDMVMANATLKTMHQTLMQPGNLTDSGTSLRSFFKSSGVRPKEAGKYLQEQLGDTTELKEFLDSTFVEPSLADELSSFVKSDPGSMEYETAIGNAIDDITQITKTGLTIFWPAFVARNFVSGQVNNIALGGVSDVKEYVKAFKKAMDVLKNPSKYQDALDDILSYGVYGEGSHGIADIGVFGGGLDRRVRSERTSQPIQEGHQRGQRRQGCSHR